MQMAAKALLLLLIAWLALPTVADCQYTAWGDWTSCTDSCQNLQPGATVGLQQRWRQVSSQAAWDQCADKFQTRSCSCDVTTGFVLPAAVGSVTTLLLLMCCACACCFIFSPKARARRAVRPIGAPYREAVITVSAFVQTHPMEAFGDDLPKSEDVWPSGTPVYDPEEPGWLGAWEAFQRRDEYDDPCAICCENLMCRPQVLLSCSHVFHRACMAHVERSHGPHNCPLCRMQHYGKRVLCDGEGALREYSAQRIQRAWWRYRARTAAEPPMCLVSAYDSMESMTHRP
eukprot:GGOE01022886.1.p1 GENE.GGOE01022886.1~~GGOE01022886.1.p1  ORF type:complete len:287 (-),score=55.65 GGOE01022886.1:562-1422(-)